MNNRVIINSAYTEMREKEVKKEWDNSHHMIGGGVNDEERERDRRKRRMAIMIKIMKRRKR